MMSTDFGAIVGLKMLGNKASKKQPKPAKKTDFTKVGALSRPRPIKRKAR